jgi:hypothetical protein
MKYETPELTALTAVNAIQTSTHPTFKAPASILQDAHLMNDVQRGYADWED